MILQDEQGNKYEFVYFSPHKEEHTQGYLKPIQEKKYVEGAIAEVGNDGFKTTIGKSTIIAYDSEIKNIHNETLIKTIVQCLMPDCVKIDLSENKRAITFRDARDNLVGYLQRPDQAFDLPEIEIKRI